MKSPFGCTFPIDVLWLFNGDVFMVVLFSIRELRRVFPVNSVAAPLAVITGLWASPAWSKRWTRASWFFPGRNRRKMHFPVMVYSVLFIVTHVPSSSSPGRCATSITSAPAATTQAGPGFRLFAGSLVLVVAARVLAHALPPVASLTGEVTAR